MLFHTMRLGVPARRGAILISVLVFVVISSFFLLAMSSMVCSYYNRSCIESNYAGALDLAEAGVNYELNQISTSASNADAKGSTSPYGNLYSFGAGTFRVYVTERSGATPWNSGDSLTINSTGTVNGVSRTLQVAATPYGASSSTGPAGFGLFGMDGGIVNGNAKVTGNVGANSGSLILNGNVTITGAVDYTSLVAFTKNGSSSVSGAIVSNMPQVSSTAYPTVETLATTMFPSGGLTYLATHNDNGLASQTISSSTIINSGTLTLNSKAGGANYYMSTLIMNGTTNIVFNNSLGPINIWVGPSGSSQSFIFNGATSAVTMSSDPTKAVTIYVATTNDVTQNGNVEFDAAIYDINNSGTGRVIVNGAATLNSDITAESFIINGNCTLNSPPGYYAGFSATAPQYYKFDPVGAWTELNTIH